MKTQVIRLALTMLVGLFAFSGEAQTLIYTNIWNIAPGSRPYVATGTTERGIAISPIDGRVYIVSRSASVGGLGIYVLNGEDGTEILDANNAPLTLRTNGISGGALILNSIAVADDGVIYACNVATATNSFKVYRWADVNSDPTVAFGPLSPGPGTRYGDAMDVRGSGTTTQIIVSGASTAGFAVLTTTDGLTFSATGFSMPAGTSAGDVGKGIAFGEGDTLFGKKDTTTGGRKLSFNLGTSSAAHISDITLDTGMGPIDVDSARNILGGLLVGAANDSNLHRLKIYDVSNPAAPQLVANYPFPAFNVNDTGVGAVDYGSNKFVAVDPGNGVVAVRVDITFAPIPPTFSLQPQDQTVLSGGFVTFHSDADGSAPMSFQWFFNGNPVLNATNKSLLIKPAYTNNAGNYFVRVTNAGGFAQSDTAVLSVIPSESTDFASEIWSLGAGARPYLTSTTRQRGMAYNPATDRLLIQSGSVIGGPAEVYVLNAATGADLHQMDMTGVTGGYFPLNVIAAAEDGVVYGLNMSLRGEAMKLYRWENDSAGTVPTVAYGIGNVWGNDPDGNPIVDDRNRLGDTINIRGRGTNTQIICTANGNNKAVIFTTVDGLTFTPNVIDVPGMADLYQFRLGVAFGAGNTFWAKGLQDDNNGRSEPAPLRNIAYNLTTGVGEVVRTYNTARNTMSAIGVEVQNDILAGLNFGTPDSIKVYDISDLSAEPPVMDQDFYATDNANQFFTGAFDSGGGRLYSLNTGNGLLCLKIKDVIPGITKQPTSLTNAVGTRAVFSVKSTGYPRVSQWQHNGVNLPGANTSTLTIHDVRGSNAGTYRLVITNVLGSVTSSVVTLRVSAGILTQPQPQVVNAGDTFNISVNADGEAPLNYQWRLNGTNILGANSSTYSVPNVQATHGGEYSVVVTGPLNTVTSQSAYVNVLQPSTPGSGTGLQAHYWNNDTTRTFPGTPTLSRIDPEVNFQWGYNNTPDGYLTIGADNFTARWSGQVQPLYSQEYTFHANTDDGVRLFVNGQKIIDRWTVSAGESSGKITLTANQKYNITMEYFENIEDSFAELRWSSISQLKAIVPVSQLYPTMGATPVAMSASRSGSSLVISWPSSSFSLQSSTNVAGPYSPVAGATSPYTNSVTGAAQRYFRLISN